MQFKDHFSDISQNYQASRPTYPADLFDYLSHQCKQTHLAWDCATGNGQSANGLAVHFKSVIATDASREQIAKVPAEQASKIDYRVASAEHSGLDDCSIDLITVAQALHWFDTDQFAKECHRVLKPEGVLAVWCYKLLSITPEIDKIITDFYFGEIGDYWPAERKLVDNGYADIKLPFQELETPDFTMQAHWSLEHLLNYLNTWSAVSHYKRKHNHNPVQLIEDDIRAAWGNTKATRLVEWPLMLRAFKQPS